VKWNKDDGCPLWSSNELGMMKNEYENHHILEFCCSASKSYTLKLKNSYTNQIEYVFKSKGLRLSHEVCTLLPYETFKNHILNISTIKNNELFKDVIVLPTTTIHPNKCGQIFTHKSQKIWKPIITKGIILNNLSIVPFGYFDYNNILHLNSLKLYKEINNIDNESLFLSLSFDYIKKYL
jgi:hypothetical protein